MKGIVAHVRAALAQPMLFAIMCLGFSSGLPLSLTASTLGTWLADVGVDNKSIGLFAAIAIPYSLKFLWAPLLDGFLCPVFGKRFGRRRGWMLLTQVMIAVAIVLNGMVDPVAAPFVFAGMGLLIAIFSATQDIVIDAYRVEILPTEQQGSASAMITFGYRMAMLVSGAGALWLSDRISWTQTYLVMAGFMVVGIITTLLVREPVASEALVQRPDLARRSVAMWLQDTVVAPFKDFMQRQGWIQILIFVVLFKLADAFLGVMFNPFLLSLGFTKTHIAEIVKLYGLVATIVGTFIGGALVTRYGVYRVLFSTSVLHMFTNLLLVVQANLGMDMNFLKLCVVTENLTAGMGTAAFVAYLSSLCRVRYTATQYALLSSLASVARTMLSTSSGKAAEFLGWEGFFLFSSLLALPSIVMLVVYHKKLWGSVNE